MTFETVEESRASGTPAELFFFRYGSAANAFYAYTDHDQTITFDGDQYAPIPIYRDDVSSKGTLDKATVNVKVPITSGISELFKTYPPSQVVTIVIRQGHVIGGADEYPVMWTGRVLSCKRDGPEATLTCEPVATSMKRSGLRRNYQLTCPHVLYGPQCNANKVTATINRPIISLTSTSITLADGFSGGISPLKYIGGTVEWEGVNGRQYRTILRVTDLKTLALSGPTTGLVAGNNVDVILGCNRQMGVGPQPDGDCQPLHNNIQNFGGQAWIPTDNPIDTNPFN
jgi:hypothetical protein